MHPFTKILKTYHGNEVANWRHRLNNQKKIELQPGDTQHLENLEKRGWTVIPSQFNESDLEEIRTELDRAFERTELPIWSDDEGADHRLFGFDSISEKAKQFYQFADSIRILSAYTRIPISFMTTMGGRIKSIEKNKGSGGGWHRDTAEFRQVKSIMYASPIDLNNGPFQYVDGSHIRKNIPTYAKYLKKDWNERRFTNEEVENLCNQFNLKVSTLVSSPGEIILVDTSGLHRGKPLDAGTRYALTNYIWNHRLIPPHIKQMIYTP